MALFEAFFNFGSEVSHALSAGHFGTTAKIWDTLAPNTWCRNVLGLKCPYTNLLLNLILTVTLILNSTQ